MTDQPMTGPIVTLTVTLQPDTKVTQNDGFGDFWAGPRGWAVYAPQ